MISFEFKPQKFAASAAYLAVKRPGLTKKQICKLLFFADKEHLLRYGRTITGDIYYKLEQGPVPSNGLYAMNGQRNPEHIAAVRKYGQLDGWVFRVTNPPDLKVLSKTDLRVLDKIIEEKGHLPASKLEEISHKDPAWINARPNGPMEFEAFFEDCPGSESMRELVLEEYGASKR